MSNKELEALKVKADALEVELEELENKEEQLQKELDGEDHE